jgi:GMP synthase (glutamine-hydrolysing)
MTRILILKTGTTAPEVSREHGDYDRWFTAALESHGLEFRVRDVTGADPAAAVEADGIIVTGSVRSVCRVEPWMERLGGLLREAEVRAVPLLGVCFGAQLLAWAHGGRVIESPAGWEIGAVAVELRPAAGSDPLFAGIASPMPVLATHEDRIEELPAGAVLLAGNRSAPAQAFRLGACHWGVQFHPEATGAILQRLIRLRGARLEEDAVRRGLPAQGHVERLVADLRGFTAEPARRLLDNFVGICGAPRPARMRGSRSAAPLDGRA